MTSIFDADLWDLGKYILDDLDTADKIHDIFDRFDIKELQRQHVSDWNMHLRSPGRQGDSSTRTWHTDSYTGSFYLGLWATTMPTQLIKNPEAKSHPKRSDVVGATVLQLEPSRFYLMNNRAYWHKQPYRAWLSKKRWFLRVTLDV